MKGTFPRWAYVLITAAGILIIAAATVLDLNIAFPAVGAGLLAYGANRLIGEWRVNSNPEYAKKLKIANQDERLAYIADKARSMTLGITVILLAVLGIILIAIGSSSYGNMCLYIMCGISALYFIIYRIVSSRY